MAKLGSILFQDGASGRLELILLEKNLLTNNKLKDRLTIQ